MKKPLLCLWLLAIILPVSSQDLMVLYETVPGFSADTVMVYLQSTDPNPKDIGAVSFSFCYQQASTLNQASLNSGFTQKWGKSFEKIQESSFQTTRDGIGYQNQLLYGNAAFLGSSLIAPPIGDNPILLMKIPFNYGRSLRREFYMEKPSQNPLVGVGSSEGDPYVIMIVNKAKPFPVEWLYLEANPIEDRKVHLDWATAAEVQNDFFSIEKSPNGKDFTHVATLKGEGFSNTPTNYHYEDATLMYAQTFYRIAQVDLGGSVNYSDIIEVTFSDFANQWLFVYPSPVEDFLFLEPQIEMKGNHFYRIIDVGGNLVTGSNWIPLFERTQLSLSHLSSGIYTLQSKDDTGKVNFSRFVKK